MIDCGMNLEELGKTLEGRREELGIARAALARRLDLSPSYVWLIERAVRRRGGEPSRPSRDLLERWVQVLNWDADYQRKVFELAGYSETPGSVSSGRPLI